MKNLYILVAPVLEKLHGFGGVQIFYHNLALELAAMDNEVLVITSQSNYSAHVPYKIVTIPAKIYGANIQESTKPNRCKRVLASKLHIKLSSYKILKTWFHFGKLVRKYILENISHQSIHIYCDSMLAAFFLSGIQKVTIGVQVHGITSYAEPELFSILRKHLLKYALMRSNYIAYLGDASSKKFLSEVIPPEIFETRRIAILRNGFKKENRVSVSASVKSERILLYIGQLAPIKQPEKIFSFISELNINDLQRTTVYVIGDGLLKENLLREKTNDTKYKNITFLGSLPEKDLREHMRNADALLSTSPEKNILLVEVEAVCTGLPIIWVDQVKKNELEWAGVQSDELDYNCSIYDQLERLFCNEQLNERRKKFIEQWAWNTQANTLLSLSVNCTSPSPAIYLKGRFVNLLKLLYPQLLNYSIIIDIGGACGYLGELINKKISNYILIDPVTSDSVAETRLQQYSFNYRILPNVNLLPKQQLGDKPIVLLLDILEHLDDPEALLETLRRKVPHNTVFVVSVPFNFYNQLDTEYPTHKHFRKDELLTLLNKVGYVTNTTFIGGLQYLILRKIYFKLHAQKFVDRNLFFGTLLIVLNNLLEKAMTNTCTQRKEKGSTIICTGFFK